MTVTLSRASPFNGILDTEFDILMRSGIEGVLANCQVPSFCDDIPDMLGHVERVPSSGGASNIFDSEDVPDAIDSEDTESVSGEDDYADFNPIENVSKNSPEEVDKIKELVKTGEYFKTRKNGNQSIAYKKLEEASSVPYRHLWHVINSSKHQSFFKGLMRKSTEIIDSSKKSKTIDVDKIKELVKTGKYFKTIGGQQVVMYGKLANKNGVDYLCVFDIINSSTHQSFFKELMAKSTETTDSAKKVKKKFLAQR